MPHVHRSDAHGGFDAWAATYDRSGLQGLFFDRVHARVVRELRRVLRGSPGAPVVVDVGCGTGRLLARLRGAFPGATLIGVDASAEMIAVAARKDALAGVRLLEASAASLPLDDGSCDVVVSTISFHHWENQAGGLREVSRVLRPGGHLLLVDAFAGGPWRALLRRWGSKHGVGLRSHAELVALVHGGSLQALSYSRVGPPTSPLGVMTAVRA